MLFETVLLLIAAGVIIFFIGIPFYKLIRAVPVRKDPVKEAKIRLELAEKELEAAKLNKKTEQLYTEMYSEVLEDEPSEKGKKQL